MHRLATRWLTTVTSSRVTSARRSVPSSAWAGAALVTTIQRGPPRDQVRGRRPTSSSVTSLRPTALQLEMIGRHAIGMRTSRSRYCATRPSFTYSPSLRSPMTGSICTWISGAPPRGAAARAPTRPPGPAGPGSPNHGPRHPRHAPVFQPLQQAVEPIHGHGSAMQRPIVRRVAQDHGGHGARASRRLRGTPAWRRCCRRSHGDLGLDGNDVHLDGGGGQRCAWRWGSEVAVMLQARGTDGDRRQAAASLF